MKRYQIINEIKSLFDIENDEYTSQENQGSFKIGNDQMTREDVTAVLENYFIDKPNTGFYVSITSPSNQYTFFTVEQAL